MHTAQPAPRARRDRLDRERRRGPLPRRRRHACCRSIAQFADKHCVREGDRVIRSPGAPVDTSTACIDYEALLAGADRTASIYAEHERERRGRDVLHLGHDRAAERRRLLASLDGAAHAGRLPRPTTGASRAADVRAAGDADVPRELLGPAVRRRDDGRRRWSSRRRISCRDDLLDLIKAEPPTSRSACRRSGSA